jgi:hypothetical protein
MSALNKLGLSQEKGEYVMTKSKKAKTSLKKVTLNFSPLKKNDKARGPIDASGTGRP